MARGKFVLSIGDDNVILTHFIGEKLENAWMGSPDPELAHEEFGEALATDRRADIAIIVDTLDQTYQQDDLPKVGLLDRRKILNRHMLQEFAGQNLRGAKLVRENPNKTLTYQFVSIAIEGPLQGWLDYVNSLPNELVGYYAIATEGFGMTAGLVPEDLPPVEEGNHWRHIIGVNVTGGFRQVIEKNDSLGFTRLTQAPPEGTSAKEFAENISRDFKATVTYIKRLGYTAGDTLDLIVLTSREVRAELASMELAEARSVTVLTPSEAAERLGLGSIGSEDQTFCDVLYAAHVANQQQPYTKLSRAAIGDAKEDLRDLGFLVAPYAAGIAMLALFFSLGWNLYQQSEAAQLNLILQGQAEQARNAYAAAGTEVGVLPHSASRMRRIFAVVDSLEDNQVSFGSDLMAIFDALDGDGFVLDYEFRAPESAEATASIVGEYEYYIELRLKLDQLILTAEEALEVSKEIEVRLQNRFDEKYSIEMTLEPVGAQAEEDFKGGLFGADAEASISVDTPDSFYAEYRIVRMAA